MDNAPLTEELAEQYNAEARDPLNSPTPRPSQPVYTRYDLGKMSIVNFGIVVDASIIQLKGTSDTGWRVGTAAGGLNALNSGTTSTESIVLRILGGALVGAAVESSLTKGQAFEYIIQRDDGKLISTLNRSRLSVGDCLIIRTDPSNSKTLLEIKQGDLCARLVPQAREQNAHSLQDVVPTEPGDSQREPERQPQIKQENGELLVGRWCDKQVPSMPIYNGILEIVSTEPGVIELRRRYGDGSSGTSTLTQSVEGIYAVANSTSGDRYRIVSSSGSLELLDDEGLIRVATRLSDKSREGECGF